VVVHLLFVVMWSDVTRSPGVACRRHIAALCCSQEPKLDMARRVVSGPLFNEAWVQLDDEIAAYERSLTQ
jgi:hypothetical protein